MNVSKKVLYAYMLFLIALVFAASTLPDYIRYVICLMGIYAIASISLSLTNGFLDVFSLGHAAFMGIGAYTAALLTFPLSKRPYYFPQMPEFLRHAYLPFPAALIVGGLFSALIAFLIGIPVLRLRGHYLAVATLGLVAILQAIFLNWIPITRGALGISGIPSYTNIWWVYLWLAITIYVSWRLVYSSYGSAMIAIREDELAARSVGINPFKYRLLAFSLGAFFAGIAGGLWAHLVTLIDPATFSFTLTFNIVIMLIIGGMSSISGAALGAFLMTTLMFVLEPIEESLRAYGMVELIFATMLVIVMIFRPTGILGEYELTPENIIRFFNKILIKIRG